MQVPGLKRIAAADSVVDSQSNITGVRQHSGSQTVDGMAPVGIHPYACMPLHERTEQHPKHPNPVN